MINWLKTLFVAVFGANSALATIIISMIPIIELRGAIPFGAAVSLWGEAALPVWKSFLFAVLGSSIICVVLTFLFWPLFKWLKSTKGFKKLANKIENKLQKKSKNISEKAEAETEEKKGYFVKWMGVLLFVAIPLPLTGVWTGTCLALFLGLSKKDTILSVLIGNLIAGAIMTIISYFFADNTMIVLLAFLVLILIFVVVIFIKSLIDKHKKKIIQEEQVTENSQN